MRHLIWTAIFSLSTIGSLNVAALNCYSCMSQNYRRSWRFLEGQFTEPLSFSPDCDSHGTRGISHVRLKPCRDMCIWIRSQNYVGSRHSGYKYIRGCMSDVLHYNSTTVHGIRDKLSCNYVGLQELFNRGSKGYEYYKKYGNREVMICSCHNSNCNAMLGSGPATTSTSIPVVQTRANYQTSATQAPPITDEREVLAATYSSVITKHIPTSPDSRETMEASQNKIKKRNELPNKTRYFSYAPKLSYCTSLAILLILANLYSVRLLLNLG